MGSEKCYEHFTKFKGNDQGILPSGWFDMSLEKRWRLSLAWKDE